VAAFPKAGVRLRTRLTRQPHCCQMARCASNQRAPPFSNQIEFRIPPFAVSLAKSLCLCASVVLPPLPPFRVFRMVRISNCFFWVQFFAPFELFCGQWSAFPISVPVVSWSSRPVVRSSGRPVVRSSGRPVVRSSGRPQIPNESSQIKANQG